MQGVGTGGEQIKYRANVMYVRRGNPVAGSFDRTELEELIVPAKASRGQLPLVLSQTRSLHAQVQSDRRKN
jgi:hypothetical protein